jgi:hypothetical protein
VRVISVSALLPPAFALPVPQGTVLGGPAVRMGLCRGVSPEAAVSGAGPRRPALHEQVRGTSPARAKAAKSGSRPR